MRRTTRCRSSRWGIWLFVQGTRREAVRLYIQATFRGHSFELFFNLAQAHAKTFQIQQFEKAMAKAQAIDAERATHLTGLGQPDLVLDPAFPMLALGQRLWLSSDGSPWVRLASSRVAPGWLGVSPVNVLGVLCLALDRRLAPARPVRARPDIANAAGRRFAVVVTRVFGATKSVKVAISSSVVRSQRIRWFAMLESRPCGLASEEWDVV